MDDRIILLVESDANLRSAIKTALQGAGYQCMEADNERSAISVILRQRPQLILSQIDNAPDKAIELLNKIQRNHPEIAVMFMAQSPTVSLAVEVMRKGAVDFISKKFEPDQLIERIKPYFTNVAIDQNSPVAQDARSKQLLTVAKRVAMSNATVLISGESGTGKEVLARYIHDHSSRANQPFVAINCAAIPENMLEATLFGYEKGAFTGAYKAMPGKFEQAQGGTLLLDEISEMDLALQAKLLRVLQEREIERLGSNTLIQLDVRVLATTNRNMRDEVRAGRFREDLFYRLNVFPLHWIPLRERPDDILPMAHYILDSHAKGLGKAIPHFSPDAELALSEYSWPGNAREMDNVIQRALILQQGDIIEVDDLQLENEDNMPVFTSSPSLTPHNSVNASAVMTDESEAEVGISSMVSSSFLKSSLTSSLKSASVSSGSSSSQEDEKSDSVKTDNLKDDVKVLEFKRILAALHEFSGDRKSVAQSLGISERTLRYKMAKMRDQGTMV